MTWPKREKLFSRMINQRLLVQDIAWLVCMNNYVYMNIVYGLFLYECMRFFFFCLCVYGCGNV